MSRYEALGMDDPRLAPTDLRERTPIVTIQLDLRPQPPADVHPYWWGLSTLDFHDNATDACVWRAELADLTAHSSWSAKVSQVDGGRWVLVLTRTHDKAKSDLDHLGLPHFVSGPVAGLATADPLASPTVDRPGDNPTVPLGAEEGGS